MSLGKQRDPGRSRGPDGVAPVRVAPPSSLTERLWPDKAELLDRAIAPCNQLYLGYDGETRPCGRPERHLPPHYWSPWPTDAVPDELDDSCPCGLDHHPSYTCEEAAAEAAAERKAEGRWA